VYSSGLCMGECLRNSAEMVFNLCQLCERDNMACMSKFGCSYFPFWPYFFSLSPLVAPSTVPPMKPWGREAELLVLGIVSCASVAFLLLTGIICYKAIKR
uniref:Uncharacterized protein n=1 Tax=Electrophorus electricus TaxID=8005 RepID=A0A4W4FIJ8_ELEEL